LIVVLRSLPRRRDAVAAGEEQLFWCAAEKSKFCLCAETNYPGAPRPMLTAPLVVFAGN
jgi:hypothetical protein